MFYRERFCNKARGTFVDAGLIDDSRPLLLHATLVNTVYVSGRKQGRGRGSKRLLFDARNLAVCVSSYLSFSFTLSSS